MKTRVPVFFVLAATASASLGCGGTLYTVEINDASNKVAQAKAIGAEKLATYEYYYANEHLEAAMSEAAEGDYSDAIAFAEEAERHADKAIQLSREARRGAAR
ncbi:MAG TPA: DUF4398 domain-containing protein [Polyangiaceae bacterium]|jgi:hypothetical protein